MKKILYILILTFLPFLISAQENPKIKKKDFLILDAGKKEAWKSVKKGNKNYKKQRYILAAESYSAALDYNEMYAPLLYKAGVSECFAAQHDLALRHLSDAYDFSANVAFDCQFWLGVAKQHLNKFDDARRDFDDCGATLDKKGKKLLENKIRLRIMQCTLGAKLMKAENKAVSSLLEGDVNTPEDEIAPVFGNIDSSLYYGFKKDIFAAKAENGRFLDPKNVKNLNKKRPNDYPVNMNLNGTEIFTCRKDKKILHFYKKSENSKFRPLKKVMKKTVSISFSRDSSSVLICAKKGKDLVGGYDVFIVKKRKGKYQKPQNLGEKINSEYDEMFATFGNNDTVIYFASNGQYSVGEFDILKASFHGGKVGKVDNLGLGINSGTDENFFQLSPGEERIGYYSSKQKGGKGGYDIYKVLLLFKMQINLPPLPHYELAADLMKEPVLPLDEPQIIKTMRLTVVKGKITDYDGNCLDGKITVTDNSTSKIMQQINVNAEDCGYTVMLESGKNYGFTATSDGYFFHSENFDIPKTSDYQEIEKNIKLLPMDPGSKVVLNNVFFDTGKSDLRPESFGELDGLAQIFKLYPKIVIEVSGHTDNQGNRQYNIQLSQSRADAVRDYIISQGVEPERIVAKGYGPDMPRDTNATEEGRQMNRRVEAKILSN